MPKPTSATDLDVTGAVDAHHHLWRVRDLPWLSGPIRPRIFGEYEALRRDYLGDEYGRQVRAAGFTDSVYVQANWPLERSVDEVRWVQRQHEETGWPSAIVGAADLLAPGAVGTFAAQREASELMRGIRLQLHWHENEQYRFAARPDQMHDPVLRENIARLAEFGWVFELQVFAGQMRDAARFVAEFPEITFVLVHAGMLESTRRDHVEPWRAGLEQLAAEPNVFCKLSGQGTFVRRIDTELIDLVLTTSLELFGSRRCLFGTNLPVETIWTDAATLTSAWFAALARHPVRVRQDVLATTARRVYRL